MRISQTCTHHIAGRLSARREKTFGRIALKFKNSGSSCLCVKLRLCGTAMALRLILLLLVFETTHPFCPQPVCRPPPTRLYQDSVLRQWWKTTHGAPSTSLPIPNAAAMVANVASKTRRRRYHDNDRAPGWGAFSWDDDNDASQFLLSVVNGDDEHNKTIVKKSNNDDDNVIIFTRRNTTRSKPTRKSKAAQLVLPSQTKRSDVLTVADLEAILVKNNLLTKVSTSSSKNIAFPQPSRVSDTNLQYGRTFAASVLGMLVGASVLPNLWMIGGVFGAYYGYKIPNQLETPSFPASILTFLGERTAQFVLWWHDAVVSVLFLYKTGQLSYQYYKTYAAMDQRWGVQKKMDAWNARFVSGKQKFDAWEQNNEIGRKSLAFLRTVWLVEEKQRRRYRQRLVKFSKKTWLRLQGDQLVVAVASAVAIGIVWSVLSAPVAMILALGLGAIWPNWLSEWLRLLRNSSRLSTITIRSASVSSKINDCSSSVRRRSPTELLSRTRAPTRRLNPPRIHYYRSANGRKRYYRTAQPMWPWQRKHYERPPRWKFWLW